MTPEEEGEQGLTIAFVAVVAFIAGRWAGRKAAHQDLLRIICAQRINQLKEQ